MTTTSTCSLRRIIAPALLTALVAVQGWAAPIVTYKVTGNATYNVQSGTYAVPILEIQNPRANAAAMTVRQVSVVWNPTSATTTVVDGILKHSSPNVCAAITPMAPVSLPPGNGLTVNGYQVIVGNCYGSSGCSGNCDPRFFNSCGSTCMCIAMDKFMTQGFCAGRTGPDVDRMTFEVEIDQNGNTSPASVQFADFVFGPGSTMGTIEIKGVRGSEVDRDSVQ